MSIQITAPHALDSVEPIAAERHSPEQQTTERKSPERESVERRSTQPAPDSSGRRIQDRVTLSPAARARESASVHPRFGTLSSEAHADPALAQRLAHEYAHRLHAPIYDRRGEVDGTGPVRYSATGEAVTSEKEALYQQQAETLHAASLALYDEEKGKGTEAADIFDKLIALGSAQPAELRAVIDWEGKLAESAGGTPPT